ncbi:alpha/beta fold hydrolase [Kitasatospora acidiphila]|uniref:alpha/beta fold hydrolase n=1 Tax=Kitasatospora acidiphila TaxID=2567942 RepID=UPI003C716008
MALDGTALDITAHDVTVAGGIVRAYDSGGDGPPVVLLHPGVGDAGIWEPMLPGLTARYRVIRYDVRGYGNSPAPTVPYSMSADLVSVLDHFGLERVPLVGCSMGGATALAMALQHPERVSALALLCPGVSGYEWPPTPELDAEYDALVAAGDLDGLTAWGLRVWGAAGSDPAAAAQLRSAAKAWPGEDEFLREDPPSYDRLGEVAVPSALLVGDLDWPPQIELNLEMARRLPGCRLTVLPGVDHLPPLRAPQLLVDAVSALLG